MAYRSGYASKRRFAAGPVARVNQRPGDCRECGELVPAGAGELYREGSGAWSVRHRPQSKSGPASMWDRAPVTGGCPDVTDRLNARLLASGLIDGPAVPERERIAAMAAAFVPAASRDAYAYSGGARMTSRRGRCEDAPCCGCCD